MFYSNGLPIAVDSFQVKHIIVKERHNELVQYNGVHEYSDVDRYFVDSILYHYREPIHCLSRHSISEDDVDDYKGTLKDLKLSSLLDTQVKPPIHECYALLALHTGKQRLRRLFGWLI